ncbi:hypothetical protein GCM10010123_27180 [Pilimelia anulata]|uniref:Uncharacterized protein n=1 Tax=Pilimelia anulata TaxID=53371 RepID=A0A8J3BBM8_9ACTN|nr:hypothetical protein GCM10010123_27180 [Pilimelia anulata]
MSGKNWYTDPMATLARSASSVVVSASYPTSSTSSAHASSIRFTRATLRPWTGTRRNGPLTTEVVTRRHPLSYSSTRAPRAPKRHIAAPPSLTIGVRSSLAERGESIY